MTDDRCQSSLSVTGEHLNTGGSNTPPKKTYKYRRVGGGSSVDETLFASHRDNLQQRQATNQRTGRESATNRSLFKEHRPPSRTNSSMATSPPIKSALAVNSPERPNSRSKYRIRSSKSYVDESLFGPPLESPTFDPPWADKEEKKGQPLFWCPPVAGSLSCTPMPAESRSGSAVGRPQSAKKRPVTPSGSKAPWK